MQAFCYARDLIFVIRVAQLSKFASTMVNLRELRVEGLPDITSLASETTSLKSLEEFHLVKLSIKNFPTEVSITIIRAPR